MRTAEMRTGVLGVTIALAASFSTLAYVQAEKQVDRVATRIETLETKVSHQEDELEKLRLRSELSDTATDGRLPCVADAEAHALPGLPPT